MPEAQRQRTTTDTTTHPPEVVDLTKRRHGKERAQRPATVVVLVAGQAYPPTLTTEQAADIWGYSSQRLYSQIGTGVLPVEPLTLGRRYRWPTVPVAQAVGLPTEIVHPAACRQEQP